MVDKDLFLHDLSIVAIMKNEGPYLKEWLDYHLLAGVDHFYIYDNESPDNQAEVVKPYVEAGLVDYIPAPGKVMQFPVYNDAVKKFKFFNRYMAFIDGDEFVYPKSKLGGGIVEVVDEILSPNPNAAALEISWQLFGSNGQEKADYSRGVLERFTRRAFNNENSNPLCKTIFNARKISHVASPHNVAFFEGLYAINETGAVQMHPGNIKPPLTEKIVINHYHCKSWEEYQIKKTRGDVVFISNTKYTRDTFNAQDMNDEFDDGILKYRDERKKIYRPPDKSHVNERLLIALMKNLLPTLKPAPQDFYAGKMETFLTCRAVAAYLKTKLTDDAPAKFFEEASLRAILRSFGGMTLPDARLFIKELPNLLTLPYPVVKDIRKAALFIISQIMDMFHLNNVMWKDYVELDYIQDLIKIGG